MAFRLETALPHQSFPTVKECSSPLFSGHAYGSAAACMSWLAILFFPDKVVFAGKPIILFLRLTVPFVTPMFLLI